MLIIGAILLVGCTGQPTSGQAPTGYAGRLSQAATGTVLPAATQANGQAAIPTGTAQSTTQATAQSTAQSTATAGVVVTGTVAIPASQGTPLDTPGASGPPNGTATVEAAQTTVALEALYTPTATPTEGTPTPRPIPSGTPPDPFSALNIYNFYGSNGNLIRRDTMNLGGGGSVDQVLFTISSQNAITEENNSNINVAKYDPVYREWNIQWASNTITGTASPLLSANQGNLGGLNGGDLLHDGSHILMVRTTTRDGTAHLQLLKWNPATGSGDVLKVVPVGGGVQQSQFNADLDLNVADLDGDGVYEVVADNVAGVQIWKWDGHEYTPQEPR